MLRNLHDEGAALRQDADEACFAELDEGFPDRRAADIEPIGDLLFGTHLAGLDLHRHDGIAQCARHLPRDGFSGKAETYVDRERHGNSAAYHHDILSPGLLYYKGTVLFGKGLGSMRSNGTIRLRDGGEGKEG